MNKQVYAKVKNEDGVNVLIHVYELEDYIFNSDLGDNFSIEFVRISDDEFEELPEFEG